MEILNQFELILLSFFYSIFFMFIYDLFNALFYKQKGKIIRFVFELILFILATLLFFICMLIIYNGKFNIFIILFLILGIILYVYLLQPFVLKYYSYLININKNKLLHFKLSIKSKFDIIKMNRRKKKIENEKNRRTKRTNKDKK